MNGQLHWTMKFKSVDAIFKSADQPTGRALDDWSAGPNWRPTGIKNVDIAKHKVAWEVEMMSMSKSNKSTRKFQNGNKLHTHVHVHTYICKQTWLHDKHNEHAV